MKIYTKVGDKGETSLVNCKMVKKSDIRLDVYGTSDELNSHLGLIVSRLQKDCFEISVIHFLENIQRYLFQFGSLLACDKKDWGAYQLSLISSNEIDVLEVEIDRIEKINTPINRFILPGGDETASSIHIARSVCRRLERCLVYFYGNLPEEKEETLLVFVNRLSDYLFVLARYVNKIQNGEEKYWH